MKTMRQKGFTMIELLIVIAITSILTVAVLASYRGASRDYALDQGIQQLISDLRKAQNMGMNGVDVNDTTDYCGYGLVISPESTSYIFYADKKNDCDNSNNKYTPGEEIETIVLSNRIIIASTTPDLDILFKYPEPTAYINQDPTPGTTGTIILENETGTEIKSISINAAGLIQRD